MAIKLEPWSNGKARVELSKRLSHSLDSRKDLEYRWQESELTVFATKGSSSNPYLNDSFESSFDFGVEDVDDGNGDVKVNYSFKNLRFIHAQLSANPPSVVARPATNDQEDRERADAADRLVRHAIRKYQMQEKVDRSSYNTLTYGTGFMKTVWDSERGDPIDFDQETGEMTLEGDIKISTPSPWNVYPDPDADFWEDVRYVFERIYIPYDEAIIQFGEEYKEILQKNRVSGGDSNVMAGSPSNSQSAVGNDKYDAVELFEYWERGLPSNAYLGRKCICDRTGTVLGSVEPSPHRFAAPGAARSIEFDETLDERAKEARIKRLPKIARLPYHAFTDIDIPNKIWGRSSLEYANGLQDIMNRLDLANLDNIQANGVNRLVISDDAEVADDSIINSNWDVIKVSNMGNGPYFMEAARPIPAIDNYRSQMKQGVDDMMGVNDAMFGQTQRETSGFSMQYATNQGNMIRRRLFNKYTLFVEAIYKDYLSLVREHWDLGRVVSVLGDEQAMESAEFKGADIDGGFDLVVEYGASLSLDPTTRRDELMTLQPIFEKAGVSPRKMLKLFKLNELEGAYDKLEMAERRQREIFEVQMATESIIEPEEFMDHENMIAWALDWFMTAEFRDLSDLNKELCRQHIRLRKSLMAQELSGGVGIAESGMMPPGPAPQGPAGVPGAVPGGPEMSAEQADTAELPGVAAPPVG